MKHFNGCEILLKIRAPIMCAYIISIEKYYYYDFIDRKVGKTKLKSSISVEYWNFQMSVKSIFIRRVREF